MCLIAPLLLILVTISTYGAVDIFPYSTPRTHCITPNGEILAFSESNYTGEETFSYEWYFGSDFTNLLDASDLSDGSALDGLGTDHVVGLEEGIYGIKSTSNVTSEVGYVLAVVEFDPQVQDFSIQTKGVRSVFEADGEITVQNAVGGAYDFRLYDEHPAFADSPIAEFISQTDFPITLSSDLSAATYYLSATDHQTGCDGLQLIDIDTAFYVWNGTVDKDWDNGGNWNLGTTPVDGSDVFIKDLSDWITIDGQSLTLRNLLIESGVNYDIVATDLLITEDLSNEGFVALVDTSTIKINGEAIGGGFIGVDPKIVADGSLHMSGAPIGGYKSLAKYWFGYDNTTSSFTNLGDGDIFDRGKGYFVGFIPGYSKSYIGQTLNYANNHSIWVTDESDSGGDGFNILSNPFLSYLSVADFLNHPDNEEICTGVIYIWNDGGTNYGDTRAGNYVTINNMGVTGQTPVNGSAGLTDFGDFNGYLHVTQGFFVEAEQSGFMNFTSDMSYGVGRDFEAPTTYRNDKKSIPMIRLTLSDSSFQDDLLIGLHPDATDEIDYGLDALKRSGNLPLSISGIQDENAYSMIALPDGIKQYHEIPVEVSNDEQRLLNLHWEIGSQFINNFSAVLTNQRTGQVYDMEKVNDLTVGNNSKSFVLKITSGKGVLSSQVDADEFSVFGTVNRLTLVDGSNAQNELVFYNLSGVEVYRKHLKLVDNKAVISDLPLIGNQLYLVKYGNKSLKIWLNE